LKLKTENDAESVHLAEWPESGELDSSIITNMVVARNVVSIGLEARQKERIQIRQPLAELVIEYSESSMDYSTFLSEELINILKEEINVKKIIFKKINGPIPHFSSRLDTEITPELKQEGNYRELVRAIQDMRKKMGLTPSDVISLSVETNNEGKELIQKFETELLKTILASKIEFKNNDAEETKIDELIFKIKIEK
jgi:isoleucyl-tRNA synthetase